MRVLIEDIPLARARAPQQQQQQQKEKKTICLFSLFAPPPPPRNPSTWTNLFVSPLKHNERPTANGRSVGVNGLASPIKITEPRVEQQQRRRKESWPFFDQRYDTVSVLSLSSLPPCAALSWAHLRVSKDDETTTEQHKSSLSLTSCHRPPR